jgi:hypothetical protein
MSEEGEDILQDLQVNCSTGVHKANSWDFHQAMENECQDIVEVGLLQNGRRDH